MKKKKHDVVLYPRGCIQICTYNTFNYPEGELEGNRANAVGGSTRIALDVDPEGAFLLVFTVILEKNKLSVSRR